MILSKQTVDALLKLSNDEVEKLTALKTKVEMASMQDMNNILGTTLPEMDDREKKIVENLYESLRGEEVEKIEKDIEVLESAISELYEYRVEHDLMV